MEDRGVKDTKRERIGETGRGRTIQSDRGEAKEISQGGKWRDRRGGVRWSWE